MRTFPALAGSVLALAAAGIVMAATPTPTPAPTAKPPAAGSTPTTQSAAPTTSSAKTWTAQIKPLDVTTGSATILEKADGAGTITVTLKGLRPDVRWTVDVDSGTSTRATDSSRHEIALRTGTGVEKVSSDTFKIHLTKAEMKRFLAERKANGAAVLVSDGVNRSAAVFAAG
jgi:hypothetical protein